MVELENPRHEKFCQLRARGVKQGEAYIQSGFAKNPGAASRLASSPVIIDRIQEIEDSVREKVTTAITVPGDVEEGLETLAEMGLDMAWVANAYSTIYQQALTAGSFAAANSAIANLQKMIEIEQNGAPEVVVAESDKISVQDTLKMLNVMKDMATLAQKSQNGPEPEPEMIDVTPQEVLKGLNT